MIRNKVMLFLKIIPGCSLAGLMLKLKCQYFGHLTRRVDWLENTVMLGGIECRRMPGSSPGGSRELEGWTALAWKDLFVY